MQYTTNVKVVDIKGLHTIIIIIVEGFTKPTNSIVSMVCLNLRLSKIVKNRPRNTHARHKE